MKAKDYFCSYENYFWTWEENSEVITIRSGSTIAYREDLINHLLAIAENGLPSFGSILLTIVALNENNDNSLGQVYSIFQNNNFYIPDTCKEAFQFLTTLQSLPKEFKHASRRQILLRTIFEESHNRINIPTSRGLVTFIKDTRKINNIPTEKEISRNIFYNDVRIVQLLNKRYPNTASIIDAMGNLPVIEVDDQSLSDIQSKDSIHYKDFVEKLMSHHQTFHLGVLVKPIWAGFKIPIFQSHPSEQALGGISDLSNKGSFDKLLVSEFANDDLLFLSRVANNEALYLNREMPPISNDLKRIVIVDISLKMWGIPKILAHAITAAIANHPKSKTASEIYLVGDKFYTADYNNVGKIIDQLQKVSISLYAEDGISSLLTEIKNDSKLEITYITNPDSLKYSKIQKILAENYSIFKYIITATQDGNISFLINKYKSLKLLQSIQLPLNDLWKNEIKEQTPFIQDNETVYEYPILFPIPKKINQRLTLGYDTYFISKRNLFRSSGSNSKILACDLILTNLPINGYYEIGKTEQGQLLFLSFNPQNSELCITDLISFQSSKTLFYQWKIGNFKEFLFLNKAFVLLKKSPMLFYFKPNFETKLIEIIEKEYNMEEFHLAYSEKNKKTKNLSSSENSINILKNIDSISIDNTSSLVFNRHRLNLNDQGYLNFSLMENSEFLKQSISIYKSATKSFVFKEGSEIIVNPNGLLIMISRNKQIPKIFLTSTIDDSPGIATEKHFSGNSLFYKYPYKTFLLQKIENHKLEAVKILKSYSGLGLSDTKEIIDKSPNQFSISISSEDSQKMIREFESIGCTISIFNPQKKDQEILPIKKFYETYLQEFINQIIHYESKN